MWALARTAIIGWTTFDRADSDMPHLFDRLDVVSETLDMAPVGLFTDVDGTISEIAPAPAEAVVSAVCRESLIFLAGKLALVAAVSGRSAADTRRLVGVDGIVYVGNHGYERWDGGRLAHSSIPSICLADS